MRHVATCNLKRRQFQIFCMYIVFQKIITTVLRVLLEQDTNPHSLHLGHIYLHPQLVSNPPSKSVSHHVSQFIPPNKSEDSVIRTSHLLVLVAENVNTIEAQHRSMTLGGGVARSRSPKRPRLSRSSIMEQSQTQSQQPRRGASASRKLTIRPYRKKPVVPGGMLDTAWKSSLLPAVSAIHAGISVPTSSEELYRKVEDACLHKHSSGLYTRLRDVCDQHVQSQIATLANYSHPPHTFLQEIDAVWQRHCLNMLKIRSIFLYLDRTYIVQGKHPDTRSFWHMGLVLFRKHFSTTSDVQKRTVDSLLSLINRERDGETIDNSLLKNLLSMYNDIGTYDQAFEKPFLASTNKYYEHEAATSIVHLTVPAFLKHAERRILEESDRAIRILSTRTKRPLISTVEKRFVVDHVKTILEKGFNTMCDADRKDDIKRCFTILSRANEHMSNSSESALELIRARLIAYVKNVGCTIVMDREKDSQMVDLLLDLKSRLDNLVSYSFDGIETYYNAVNLAFESFVNGRENKPAELIAKFVDGILRTGNKGFSEEELENTLDRALMLFRFIDGKDVFEAFYKKNLAKRLLYDKSASLDLEKSMISKLKAQCGPRFTSNLEAMFRDVDSNRDLMQSFRTHAASRQAMSNGLELNVFVLEASRWPLSAQAAPVKLPQNLIHYQETFKNFYVTKHNGRALTWQHMDGTCSVNANFPKGKKILNLSLYQTIVLMLFNDSIEIPYSDIANSTGIEPDQLNRTLLSLACGKVRVLHKRPKGPRVDKTDIFLFNDQFTHRSMRIKVNAIQMKETVEENTATTEKVFQERNYQVDAAIVRIMKTKRTLEHRALVAEIYSQLRFPHKPSDIKKRIESLIDRDYMERDPDNAQTYRYVA